MESGKKAGNFMNTLFVQQDVLLNSIIKNFIFITTTATHFFWGGGGRVCYVCWFGIYAKDLSIQQWTLYVNHMHVGDNKSVMELKYLIPS
jgi:hypothetical protein